MKTQLLQLQEYRFSFFCAQLRSNRCANFARACFDSWHGASVQRGVEQRNEALRTQIVKAREQVEKAKASTQEVDKRWEKQDERSFIRHVLMTWRHVVVADAKDRQLQAVEDHLSREICELKVKGANTALKKLIKVAMGVEPETMLQWCFLRWASDYQEERTNRNAISIKHLEIQVNILTERELLLFARGQKIAQLTSVFGQWSKITCDARREHEEARRALKEVERREEAVRRTVNAWTQKWTCPVKLQRRYWDFWMQILKETQSARLEEARAAEKRRAEVENEKMAQRVIATYVHSREVRLKTNCLQAFVEFIEHNRHSKEMEKLHIQLQEVKKQKSIRVRQAVEASLAAQIEQVRGRTFEKWASLTKELRFERMQEEINGVAARSNQRMSKLFLSLFNEQKNGRKVLVALLREWQLVATALYFERHMILYQRKSATFLVWSDKHIHNIMRLESLRVSLVCWKAWKSARRRSRQQREITKLFRYILSSSPRHPVADASKNGEDTCALLMSLAPSFDTLLGICLRLWTDCVHEIKRQKTMAELDSRRVWAERMIHRRAALFARLGSEFMDKKLSSHFKSIITEWCRVVQKDGARRVKENWQHQMAVLKLQRDKNLAREAETWFQSRYGPMTRCREIWELWTEVVRRDVVERNNAASTNAQIQYTEWRMASIEYSCKIITRRSNALLRTESFHAWTKYASDCANQRVVQLLHTKIVGLQGHRVAIFGHALQQSRDTKVLQACKDAFLHWAGLAKAARDQKYVESLQLTIAKAKFDSDMSALKLLMAEWRRVSIEGSSARAMTRWSTKHASQLEAWDNRMMQAKDRSLVRNAWTRWGDLLTAGKVGRSCDDVKSLVCQVLQIPMIASKPALPVGLSAELQQVGRQSRLDITVNSAVFAPDTDEAASSDSECLS
eukprot:GEMP01005526.1.p1 GENE.GEMP01005526.1~~GEMP01005526.1.p1  ORF type:complete len:911 (+),score=236.33 GEMP01005526.1:92-2824(+)